MSENKQLLTDEQMFQILLEHGIGWETGRGLEPMSSDDESGGDYIKALRAIEAAVLSASAGNWQQYAKEGETAQDVIERERKDMDALMTLYHRAIDASKSNQEQST